MTHVKAEGRLRHCFHGEYSAMVALLFQDERKATDALSVLGSAWKRSPQLPNALLGTLTKVQLDAFKWRFSPKAHPCGRKSCKSGCRSVEIDSLAHSIDYGPTFDVTIAIPQQFSSTVRAALAGDDMPHVEDEDS